MLAHGKVQGVYRKHLLPNYAVFDEQRYFAASTVDGPLFVIGGVKVGVTVCEDAWSPTGPIISQAAGGAELIVNINASPYYAGRIHERDAMLATRAADAQVPVVYVNLVGGQDELVFDGGSMAFDESGVLVAALEAVRRGPDGRGPGRAARRSGAGCATPGAGRRLRLRRGRRQRGADRRPGRGAGTSSRSCPPVHEVYEALVLGTCDYVVKNGFERVLIGLSGGIDSSLVAAIAADALGPDRVTGVLMPSRFSSEGSVTDADRLAQNLGIDTITVPIEEAHHAFLAAPRADVRRHRAAASRRRISRPASGARS